MYSTTTLKEDQGRYHISIYIYIYIYDNTTMVIFFIEVVSYPGILKKYITKLQKALINYWTANQGFDGGWLSLKMEHYLDQL